MKPTASSAGRDAGGNAGRDASRDAGRDASWAAVWGPWLAAPLFALLPIGGCGVADALGPSPLPAAVTVAAAPEAAGARAPETAVVAGREAPVVTVVTLADRRMAPHSAAD